MADLKISQLPSVFTLSATDVFPVVNQGATKKLTLQQLQSYIATTSLTATNPSFSTAITNPLIVNTSYLVYAYNASQTVTLPPNPAIGSFISFLIFVNPDTSTTVTINRNGKLITANTLALPQNLICDYSVNLTLVYINATWGWKIHNVFPH